MSAADNTSAACSPNHHPADLTRERIEELIERSKDDRAIIVGSEVRALGMMALRAAEAEKDAIERCAKVCDAEVMYWDGINDLMRTGAERCANAIRALSPPKETPK